MSNKQDFQDVLKALAKAKEQDAEEVKTAVESIHRVRQEQAETQSRQD